jgi:2-succinyl-5-enolpyruvyl-6-hydroxy-3-cyclohexene-1-carboxylate synthase
MSHKSVATLVEILYRKGSGNVIISPGSRSAPLTLAFARHKGFRKIIIPDERSAGYTALGIAQASGIPVALVCTSGTAAINLYPAVAEAFYLQVPLLVFTADRPPEWIDQHDGQTIHQENLYQNHVKGFYTFPQEDHLTDVVWHGERIISEAFNQSIKYPAGPVHLNMPFREPLYPPPEEKTETRSPFKLIKKMDAVLSLEESSWNELAGIWADSRRILIVGGQQRKDSGLMAALENFSNKYNIPVAGDAISNLHGLGKNLITLMDPVLWKQDKDFLETLKPDLLISFGKSIISKNLKVFLRRFKPDHHWHIQSGGYIPDPFQSITYQVPSDPLPFIRKAMDKFEVIQDRKQYLEILKNYENVAGERVKSFFPANTLSELEACHMIIEQLPDHVFLHLANSMAVRLVNFLGGLKRDVEVFSNRGTSGIDGCVSTAVGTAIHSEKMNVLITGDMAFFYDRNAFWHENVPDNLHIVILNNHGGGIFRMIDGPSGLPEFEKYFETYQPLTAGHLASEFGFDYAECHSRESLKKSLETFFNPGKNLKILEIQTDSKTNKTIFDQFKSQFC